MIFYCKPIKLTPKVSVVPVTPYAKEQLVRIIADKIVNENGNIA